MQPCGLDLRQRIVKAYENREGSVRELAERFDVAPNTVQDYRTLHRATGSLVPRTRTNGPPPTIDGQALQGLRSLVEEAPDATLEELADALARRHHVAVSGSTVSRALRRLKITRKKNASCDRARHERGRRGSPGVCGSDGADRPEKTYFYR